MEARDLSHIETRVKALSTELAGLSSEKDFQEFLVIIRKPGWTTPAEFAFVDGLIDSMAAHARALAVSKRALLAGGAKVSLNPQPIPPGKT
jgi:hypothetical protein